MQIQGQVLKVEKPYKGKSGVSNSYQFNESTLGFCYISVDESKANGLQVGANISGTIDRVFMFGSVAKLQVAEWKPAPPK